MDDSALSGWAPNTAAWRERLQNWLLDHPQNATSAEALETQGILPLLDWCRPQALQPALAQTARAARQQLLAREALHREVLAPLDAELGRAGIPAVLLKGEALATTLYPDAALRPRHDIDLWVLPADCASAESLLARLGATAAPGASGRWIQPERLWRVPTGRTRVGIDLHWQAVSRPALLQSLPFTRLHERGQPLGVGGTLRALHPQDALLLACVHRWAHHRQGSRLIWHIDMAMLWEQLPPGGQAAVVERACAGRVAALLQAGLHSIADWIVLEPALDEQLSAAAGQEPARRLLDLRLPDWRFDLYTTHGRQRLQVLRDYLLPDPQWLRQRYATAHWRWLPWLYLRRLLRR